MPPIVMIEAPRRLDGTSAPDFGSFALTLINAGAHRLILDFSGVTYLGSAGLRALMQIGQAIISYQGRIALLGCHPSIIEVLRICGLLEDFPQTESIEAARRAVS